MEKKIAKPKRERSFDPVKETDEIFLRFSNFREFFRMGIRDPIYLIFKMSISLYEYKIVRILYMLIFMQYTVGTTMAVQKLMTTFDKDVFFKYGPFVGCQIFILINIGSIIGIYNDSITILKRGQKMMCPVDIAGERSARIIFKQSAYLKMMCIANLICACVAAAAFSFSTDYLYEKTYVVLYVKEHYPIYSTYYNIWISFTIWPCSLLLVSLAHTFTYCGFNATFQMKNLNAMIKTLHATRLDEEKRYDSTVYQRILRQKLKVVVMAHSLVVSNISSAKEFLFIPIIAVTIGAVILGGSIMLDIAYTISLKGEATQNYIGLFFCSVAGFITTLLYVFTGQLFKDESEKVYYQLTQLPWYYMDNENRNIYLFLLMCTAKPASFTTDVVEINFLLALRISKGLYSLFCLIINFM